MDMGGSEKCPSSSYELRLLVNPGLIANHVSRWLACVCTCIDASQHGHQYPSLFSVSGIYGSGLSQGQALSLVAVQQPLSCRISATRLSFVRLQFPIHLMLPHVISIHLSSAVGASSLDCMHVHDVACMRVHDAACFASFMCVPIYVEAGQIDARRMFGQCRC